jgi:hypothetical protein
LITVILHPEREGAKLILSGLMICFFGAYLVDCGVHGKWLEKLEFTWRRHYSRKPSPALRRKYKVLGGVVLAFGLAVIVLGIHQVLRSF